MAMKVVWTAAGIEALKAPLDKDRKYLPDNGRGSVRGLVLMVTSKGSKSWLWRGRDVSGRQVKKTLGSWPTLGLADARDRAEEYNRAKLDGIDLDAQRTAQAEKLAADRAASAAIARETLEWFWTTHYVTRFKRNTEAIRLMKSRILPRFGNHPISSITEADLRKFVAEIADTKPKVADRVVVALKTLFSRASEETWKDFDLPVNPATRLKKPDGTNGVRDRALSDDEIVLFYRAQLRLTGMDRVHADCLALLLDVGGRLNEARMATFDEIDFASSIWELAPSRNKTGKRDGKTYHLILLPDAVLDRLRERRKRTKQKWVFWSPLSEGMPYNSASKSMENLRNLMVAIAGHPIPRWSAHALRHTFKTHLYLAAALGLDPQITEANIDRAQNHATGSAMGRRYDKNRYLLQKAAVYRFWQQRLMELRKRAEALEAATGLKLAA